MATPALGNSTPVLPSIFERFAPAATAPMYSVASRKLAFWACAALVPSALALRAVVRSRRGGVLAGGLAALGLGALRWQLARWFEDSPAYEILSRHGELELRRYPFRIEARTVTDAQDFETALDRGFGRLACFAYGGNTADETLAMTTPLVATMHDGVYTASLTMPPHRAMSSLPHPRDARITLREVPERRIAALRFRGEFTQDNLERHERQILRALVDAGLVARGSVSFAAYDSPSTLPRLRRNELWIEIV